MFIDVDMVQKEESFIQTLTTITIIISERHEDATKGSVMKKIHDRYSLYRIIESDGFTFCHEQLLQLLDIAISLQDIAVSLENLSMES